MWWLIRMRLVCIVILLIMEIFRLSAQEVGRNGDSVSDTITGKTHQLDNVTVTAKRLPARVTSTLPVQVISSKDIKQLGMQSMADAVRRFAGAEVRDYGGIGGLKTVSIRNMGAAHTAVSYDGVTVSNCQAGQIDIGRFSLDNVSVLSLAVGQTEEFLQSARHYASAGVLSIETERPHFENQRHFALRAQVRGGSFGHITPSLRWWQQLGDSTQLSVDASYLYADGVYPFRLVNGKYVTEEKRINSEVTSWQGEVNFYHTFHDASTLNVKAYYYESDRGLPGAVILYNPESDEHLWDRNAFLQARYKKHFSDRWSLQVQGKYNYSWNKYRDKGAEYENGVLIDRYTQHEGYLSGTVLYRPLPSLFVMLAQDISVNTLDSSLPDCPFPVRFTSLTALRMRWQTERFKADAALLNTWQTEHVESGTHPDDLTKLTPTVSLSFRPWESELYLRAMYKSTFRTPTFNDLYYYRMGNRSLRPEKAHEFNMGVTGSFTTAGLLNYFTFTVDGYFHRVTDKIVAFPTTYIWKMANFGRANVAGIDVSLTSRLELTHRIALFLNGSYTWQRAIDLTDSSAKNYRHQLPYTPRHTGTASAVVETPWFILGYTLTGVGDRYYLAQNIPVNRIDSYTEHSLSLSHEFRFKPCRVRLQADVLNVGNKQYEVIKYYPMPGRSWRLTGTLYY